MNDKRVALDIPGNATVEAPLRFAVRKGQDIAFMVRPESIAITGRPVEGRNGVEGVVRDRILTGGVTKYLVETAGNATVSASSLTMRSEHGHRQGETVWLEWSIQDTVILQDQEATPVNKAIH